MECRVCHRLLLWGLNSWSRLLGAGDMGWCTLLCMYRFPHVLPEKENMQIKRSLWMPFRCYGLLCCKNPSRFGWFIPDAICLPESGPFPVASFAPFQYPCLSIVPRLPLSHFATCLTFRDTSSLLLLTGVINSLFMFSLPGYHSALTQGIKRRQLIPRTSHNSLQHTRNNGNGNVVRKVNIRLTHTGGF